MVAATLKRTLVSILVLIGSGLWVAALLIMAQTVQQSAHFSDLHPFIVGVNVAGLLVLLILIGGRLAQLVRDWRKRVVGSRLEARMVWMSATLAMAPLLLVFYFSVVFLNRGIDSWFHVEIRQGLEDALTLSRAQHPFVASPPTGTLSFTWSRAACAVALRTGRRNRRVVLS